MKKSQKIICSLVLVLFILITSFVFLRLSNNTRINNNGTHSSLKSSQVKPSKDTEQSNSNKEISNNKKSSESSLEDASSSETENSTIQSSSDSILSNDNGNTPNTDQITSGVKINSLVSGDISSIVGTWSNDLGESLTISENGQVTNNISGKVYALSSNNVDGNIYYGTIYNPNSTTDSAAFILIPAGEENPHIGGTTSVDRIVTGQDINADYHPFFKN